jgi:NAD(P)H-dependent flavin oxidoreductase YrpB (nitropropane dioxygenase family)
MACSDGKAVSARTTIVSIVSAEQAATLFAYCPASSIIDLPLIAAGGIGNGRGTAAALTLGASAVQIGTALLRWVQLERLQPL